MANKYKKTSEELIKIYEDNEYYKQYFYDNILSKQIKDEGSRSQLLVVPFTFINFIVNSICTLYSKNVLRTHNYMENEKINDIFNIVNNKLNNITNNIDRYTFLTGTTAVKSYYDIEENEFDYHLYTSNFLDYEGHQFNQKKIKEIYINYNENDMDIFESYSKDYFERIVDDISVEKIQNPYGFIPFTFFNNKDTLNSVFSAPNTVLLDIQNTITNKILQLNNTFKFQSMSMLVLKGGPDLKQLNVGANAVNKISNDDDLKYINPEADLINLINTINEEIKVFLRVNNIPDSLLSASATSSGLALIISQSALDEITQNRSKSFMEKEKELLEKGIRVLAHHLQVVIPDDFEVNINHLSVSNFNKLSQDDLVLYKFYLEKNIISIIDLVKIINNGVHDEDIEELILKNKELNERLLPFIEQDIEK